MEAPAATSAGVGARWVPGRATQVPRSTVDLPLSSTREASDDLLVATVDVPLVLRTTPTLGDGGWYRRAVHTMRTSGGVEAGPVVVPAWPAVTALTAVKGFELFLRVGLWGLWLAAVVGFYLIAGMLYVMWATFKGIFLGLALFGLGSAAKRL